MKTKILLIALSLSSLISNGQNWNLIWQDEFDGNSIDLTNWSHDLGTGAASGLWGWGNSELQYYQPDNSTVNGGVLTIEAKEEPQGISDFYSGNIPYYYSSSKIVTRDKFEFTYGKVEARIKTIDGEGYWPAFWMLPGGCWPETGEIDIMEQWGNDGSTTVTTGAAHMGNCGSGSTYQAGSTTISNGSYADDFHTYSVVWYEDYIGWYVDDILFHSVTPSSYPSDLNWPYNDNDWYLIINLAITSSGPNANTTIPNQIEVDWVRVYQTNDILGCTDPSASNYNSMANIDNGGCEFDLTFNVDMNCTSLTFDQVYVSGPFTNWCGTCYPLTDSNNDGIWSGTYPFSDATVEYKYLVDNWTDQENLLDDVLNGASCAPITDFANYANRLVNVSQGQTSDSYGSCEACGNVITGCTDPSANNYNSNATSDDGSCTYSGCTNNLAVNYNSSATQDDGSCQYEVEFNVDMSCSDINFSTVYITGPFTTWCGNCFPLTDNNNDDIWTATYTFPEGNVEYKYEVDNWASQENLVDDMLNGATCAPVTDFNDYANRLIELPLTLVTNDAYGSCEDCPEEILGCLDPEASNYNSLATLSDNSCEYNILFSLDMTDYDSNFTTPEVNGSWDGWCGGCTPMSDLDGDNIWEATISLSPGFYEFKFGVDSWTDQEELGGIPECTLTTGEFTNRTLTVNGQVASYGTVCWESCESCIPEGCTDYSFVEYDPLAIIDNGSCSTLKVFGCTYLEAENYNPLANTDDLSCIIATGSCPGDFNGDGDITASDLTQFLAFFGLPCE